MALEDALATPEGQAQMLAMLASAPGQRPIIPADLKEYLAKSGLDKDPRWMRVIAGENPIGGVNQFGWQSDNTPMRERQQVIGPTPYDPLSGLVDERTRQVGTGGPILTTTGTLPGMPLADVRPALYFEGDADVEYSKMNNDQRAQTKQRMRDAGLLAENAGGVGSVWDSAAYNAFDEVLRYSNAKGVSWRVSMQSMKNYLDEHPEERKVKEGATLPAFVANISNPMDLKKVFETAATKIMGRVDSSQVEGFVSAFQAQQANQQRQQYDATYQAGATGVGPGGTVVDAPDATVAAEAAIRASNPAAAGGTDINSQFRNLMAIIGGENG